MKMIWLAVAAAVATATSAGAQHEMHDDMAAPKSPMLMQGYGTGGFKITTANPRAQAYFDNGMQLAHAFAHKASIEAMTEAVRLDPQCAMCLWGEAWVSGPIAFAEAAELQEGQGFSALSDPPAWAFPVRRELAAALLAQGDWQGAHRELEAALKYRPKDPGSLAALAKLGSAAAPRASAK